MSKRTPNDPRRADRFASSEGEFILHRAKGKKPLAGVQRQTALDKAGRKQAVLAVPLATLRRPRDLTQAEVAARLGVDQAQVSRLEHRSDVLLSTLFEYLTTLGGKNVELAVSFEGGGRMSVPLRRREQ